ncbi:MAG: hypothetical protein JXR60_09020 [Bacteroidales bacterium]|nr:hypothetical protein [Bacteroidales bacterium]
MSFDEQLYKEKPFLKTAIGIVFILLLSFVSGYAIGKGGMAATMAFIGLPFGAIFMNKLFINPKIGIIGTMVMAFAAIGILRYIPGKPPLGLSIDGLLVMSYLSLFFKSTTRHVPWHKASSTITYLAIIWYLYILFEIVNPEVTSREAWFFASRGVGLYMVLIIPLVQMLLDNDKSFQQFILIWGIFSILGSIKGAMQLFVGPDFAEQAWLDAGNAGTHILFGKLRVFSFYSDAGQFGAAQAVTGVVFGILWMGCENKKRKRLYLIVSLLGFYGMLISGTRGAIAAPAAGGLMFLVLKKNFKLLIPGITLMILIYIFFRFTTIMNGNAQIRRMRTGFDPDNPSLMVRKRNQKILKTYMASRPIGAGIGQSFEWAARFTPNTYLATVPTDSWFVAVWVETGVIGLTLHLFILFYVLLYGTYLVMFKLRDPIIINRMTALLSGQAGVMLCSYGNGVLGQIPTSVMLYTSMAYITMAIKIERQRLGEITEEEKTQEAIYWTKKNEIKPL